MNSPPQEAIDAAIEEGQWSLCSKSKRGVSVYRIIDNTCVIYGSGHNRPPLQLRCDGTDACKKTCNQYCLHAEQQAIDEVLRGNASSWKMISDMVMVHAKVVDGELVKGGPPGCWQCSRQILERGFKGIWLYETRYDGWMFYESLDFHLETLENCGVNIAINPLAR